MVFSKNLNDEFPEEMNGHTVTPSEKFILNGAASLGIIPDLSEDSLHFFD
jgi:hypothetical protein